MELVLVAAVAENGVIGRDNGMPWRLSTDLRRFKADTTGKPVVMGRKTFESIGKPLPGRRNIVVTRDRGFAAEGVEVAHGVEDALRRAAAHGEDAAAPAEVCVIGGGQIYAETIGRADCLRITHVLARVDGDTRFPAIDPDVWLPVSSADVPAGPRDTFPTRYVVYRRRAPSPE